MRRLPSPAALRGFALATCLFAPAALAPEVEEFEPYGFTTERMTRVSVGPEEAFDAFTGDVSGWWDHHFSKQPARFEIQPWVGGSFIEMFDEQGNGVQHAVVTYCDHGKKLVLRGPLGFHGTAIDLVTTITFEADGEGTIVRAEVHGLGEIDGGQTAEVIGQVWDHFLGQRFQPWVEAGKHRAE